MGMLNTDESYFAREGQSQYLTFILGSEEYGIDILKVQEIRGFEHATEIPNSPDYVLGIINLRGSVVPIVDLRKRFRLDAVAYNDLTVVVLVKVSKGSGTRTVGMVVDSVSDVYTVAAGEVKRAPDIGGNIDLDYIRGLATINGKMVILLDIDLLINNGILGESPREE